MRKIFFAVLIALIAQGASAQSYKNVQWGIDRTSSPFPLAINLSGSWYSIGSITSGGVFAPSFTFAFPLTVSGTVNSGGAPCFTSATVLASSAALTANALLIGGGAGACFSSTATGTGVLAALGINVGSAGSIIVNGGALGTPSGGVLSNATDLPISTGVSGLGTGVATFLGTPSSANLAAALTDETGTGSVVFANSPTFTDDITLGTQQTTQGSIILANTAAGAFPTTIKSSNSASAAWALTLPTTAGSSGQVLQTDGAGVTSWVAQSGAGTATPVFGGRLSLATGVPVMASSVTGGTTVYYVPYTGKYVTIYDGSSDSPYSIGSQISLALGTNWAANTAFDVFVTLSAGNPVLCTVAWTNVTTRATALDLTTRGYLTNSGTPTCRDSNTTTIALAANRASYLGSFYTNGSTGQVDYIFGTAASGGGASSLGIWNYYNRVTTVTTVKDSGASYTYTSATVRAARASSTNKITFMQGVAEDYIPTSYGTRMQTVAVAGAFTQFCIGLDTTSGCSSNVAFIQSNTTISVLATNFIPFAMSPQTGQHYISPNETSDGTNANTFDHNSDATLQATIRN